MSVRLRDSPKSERIREPSKLTTVVSPELTNGHCGGCGLGWLPTCTLAVHVSLPPAPVAVRVKVVSSVTLTVSLPSAVTEPTPLSIETLSASVVSQFRVTLPPPNGSEVGEAVKKSHWATFCSGSSTCTLAVQWSSPPAPSAVSVKVVSSVTLTVSLPSAVTEPTPLSIETLSASVVSHSRVTLPPPYGSEVGEAVKKSQTAGSGVSVCGCTVAVSLQSPLA